MWLLPAELSERIKAFQIDQGLASEVEAARRLLDSALQMRDTVRDILIKLKARYAEEKDLRVLARDVLTGHALVNQITLNDSDVTFRMRSGTYGQIDQNGKIAWGEDPEYMNEIHPPRATDSRAPVAPSAGSGPSWDTPRGGDLDDEMPF